MLAGANIIYGLGMLEMGMTISYSQLLMDAEMAEMMLFSMDGLTRDRWNEAGHLDMESRALIAAKELLATWEPEPLSEEACARVRAVLNAAERDYGVPESLE